jgi:hypothetical protein
MEATLSLGFSVVTFSQNINWSLFLNLARHTLLLLCQRNRWGKAQWCQENCRTKQGELLLYGNLTERKCGCQITTDYNMSKEEEKKQRAKLKDNEGISLLLRWEGWRGWKRLHVCSKLKGLDYINVCDTDL